MSYDLPEVTIELPSDDPRVGLLQKTMEENRYLAFAVSEFKLCDRGSDGRISAKITLLFCGTRATLTGEIP